MFAENPGRMTSQSLILWSAVGSQIVKTGPPAPRDVTGPWE